MDEPQTISTKLYLKQNDLANKYKAHILLSQNRTISKEQAVNELIELGAEMVFPAKPESNGDGKRERKGAK